MSILTNQDSICGSDYGGGAWTTDFLRRSIVSFGKDCRKEVAMCKIFACEKAVQVADMCIQIHGGYGYMMEYEVQRIWRDLRIAPIGGGTSEIQKEIIGRLIGL
ncbi:MAG: acyl-CoA dehydrogenase family protein [Pseudomonadota bacterium]